MHSFLGTINAIAFKFLLITYSVLINNFFNLNCILRQQLPFPQITNKCKSSTNFIGPSLFVFFYCYADFSWIKLRRVPKGPIPTRLREICPDRLFTDSSRFTSAAPSTPSSSAERRPLGTRGPRQLLCSALKIVL